ncbi:BnaCnng32910D [Brassica napus]|uniref:non-specific serine/threonine protein kinase n=1 Tax=Brassica napus TaxID=3708 RepID=A0A078J3C3_BRANA|nr:BnaCnng32910D [Brassica napus]
MYNAPGSSAPFILSVPCLLRSMALAYGELKPDLRMYWFVFFTEGSVSGTNFSLLLSCGVFLCGHKKFESVTEFLMFFNRVQVSVSLSFLASIFRLARRFVITCWFWLDYLQRELSVVHSDLKPENVLVPSMIGPSKVPRKSAHGVGSAVNGKPLNSSEEDCPSTSASSGLEVKQGARQRYTVANRTNTGSKYTTSADSGRLRVYVLNLPLEMYCSIPIAETTMIEMSRIGGRLNKEHLPLMMELLGMMPRKIALGGRYSRDLFNRHGDLGHIRRLRFWPMSSVSLTFLDQLWSSLSTTFSFTQT